MDGEVTAGCGDSDDCSCVLVVWADVARVSGSLHGLDLLPVLLMYVVHYTVLTIQKMMTDDGGVIVDGCRLLTLGVVGLIPFTIPETLDATFR